VRVNFGLSLALLIPCVSSDWLALGGQGLILDRSDVGETCLFKTFANDSKRLVLDTTKGQLVGILVLASKLNRLDEVVAHYTCIVDVIFLHKQFLFQLLIGFCDVS
jgi:hypothetical protein